jgi:hypothetical protein
MTTITTPSSLALAPSLETAWQDVDSSFERFCLTAGIDADPVSVHTLACAGCEIAEHLTRKAGAKPFSTHVLATFPDLDLRDLRQLQNQYWNAFKACKDA